jgi:hypothetical protein
LFLVLCFFCFKQYRGQRSTHSSLIRLRRSIDVPTYSLKTAIQLNLLLLMFLFIYILLHCNVWCWRF